MDLNETEDVRVRYVRVTNGLAFDFTDRHDGVPVRIAPGKSENLPLDMAQHFFGYEYGVPAEVMMRHIARRQGWNTPEYVKQNPETRKTLAQELFDKLKIEPVTYKLVPVQESDPKKPIPADPDADFADDRPSRKPPRRIEASA